MRVIVACRDFCDTIAVSRIISKEVFSFMVQKKSKYPHPHPILGIRTQSRISLRDLGREAGIDFRRLSLVEKGFTTEECGKLANALTALSGARV